jgi:hypothetical protein
MSHLVKIELDDKLEEEVSNSFPRPGGDFVSPGNNVINLSPSTILPILR